MRLKQITFFVLLALLLTGCQKLPEDRGADSITEAALTETYDTASEAEHSEADSPLSLPQNTQIHRPKEGAPIPKGDFSSHTNTFEPITWEEQDEYGKCIRFTVSNPRIVASMDGLEGDYFVKDGRHGAGEVIVFDTAWREAAIKDWIQYGEQWAKKYYYPEFVDDSGKFRLGVRMVLIDVKVENIDGAGEYTTDDSGDIVPHGSSPYIFMLHTHLLDGDLPRKDKEYPDYPPTYREYPTSYFSLRGSVAERPEDGYLVEPGQSVTFQQGFLIGNHSDGSPVNPEKLVLSSSSYMWDLQGWWCDLKLKEK